LRHLPLLRTIWSWTFLGEALFGGDKDAAAGEAPNQSLAEGQSVAHRSLDQIAGNPPPLAHSMRLSPSKCAYLVPMRKGNQHGRMCDPAVTTHTQFGKRFT
jgi:hypothetical protein